MRYATHNSQLITRNSQLTGQTQQRRWMTLLLLLGFGWRMVGLTQQSLWRDEVDVIWLSLRPLRDTVSMFVSPAQNGPLYYLLLRPWFPIAGSSPFALRYTSVLMGVLAVALLWQVARRLLPGDGKAILANLPFLAALFLAFNPYQVWYSQEGKMYALVMVLTLLSSWSWLEAMRRGGGWRWLRYLVITSLSIYTHLMTALILPVHFVWFLLASPLNRRRWRGYGLALSGFVLPYLPLVWWQWHYLTTIDYSSGYRFTPFREVVRVLLLDHTRGALLPVSHLWIVPILFLGLAGLLVGYTELGSDTPDDLSPRLPVGRTARLGIMAAWLILPVLLIHGVSLIKPIFVDRYLIWIASAFVMSLALGVQVVRRNSGAVGVWLGLGLVLFVLGFWLYSGWQQVHRPNKTQLREAVTYVAQRRQPDELLILQIPHTQYAYRYYTSAFEADPFANSDSRLDPWMEGLWTQNGLPDDEAMAQVDRQMRLGTLGRESAWVLLVEADVWDGRRLMDRWLDEHGRLVDRQQFHGVEVRHYTFAGHR